MIGIMTGIGNALVQIVLLLVVVAMVWWIAKSLMKQSWVALITAVAASAVVVWALFGGGMGTLSGITDKEASNLAKTSATVQAEFADIDS